jgi:hypothetical protein
MYKSETYTGGLREPGKWPLTHAIGSIDRGEVSLLNPWFADDVHCETFRGLDVPSGVLVHFGIICTGHRDHRRVDGYLEVIDCQY